MPSRSNRTAPLVTLPLRAATMAAVACLLAAGVVGGLLRAGVALPLAPAAEWPGHAVRSHAFLMMFAFLATAVGLERAVALRHRLAFAAPLLSALAGFAMLAGADAVASASGVAAAIAFVVVNAALVLRQPAAHTRLLLVAAFALLVANATFALGSPVSVVAPWWFAFLVVTIAAERLEMTRLMRRRRGAAAALHLCLGVLVAAAAAFAVSPVVGGALFGLSLVALAGWLFAFDIARKTVSGRGLPRYMAVCLLSGYLWLAASGAAWICTSAGFGGRDAALHALGLGFVFSMLLAHAPVIVPALARIKLGFGWPFYVPLALLHASLVLRLAGGAGRPALLAGGAAGNAAAIVAFILVLAGSALAWRWSHPRLPSSRSHEAAPGH